MKALPLVAICLALAACGKHDASTTPDLDNQINPNDPNGGPALPPPTAAKGTAEAQGIDCAARAVPPDSKNDVLGVTIGKRLRKREARQAEQQRERPH